MDFTCNIPINSVSFGQASIAILREFFKMGLNPTIFPIGNPDLSAQKVDKDFFKWIEDNANSRYLKHSRENPTFKLWHLNGGIESFSKKQVLMSFYELDNPTPEELNIIKNNDYVAFTSKYTIQRLEECGAENVKYIPLGFDYSNFSIKERKEAQNSRITFNLAGKLEKRKNHAKVLKAWAKKYGNNPRYFLNCAIFNPFLKPEDQQAMLSQILGQKYFNIQFLGFMATNEIYNSYLNQGDIIIDMSGAEGFSLPSFQSLALGKHGVILNAHVHKDWANKENAVLVKPAGKEEVYDGMFFHKGHPFNQGNFFSFNDEEFITGCEEAIKRFEKSPVNTEGLKLQQEFTYEKTANAILDLLK
jgi:glycosyltransferase involved in cell wall biosynthesis